MLEMRNVYAIALYTIYSPSDERETDLQNPPYERDLYPLTLVMEEYLHILWEI